MLSFVLIKKNYLIGIQEVWIVRFNSVAMKSRGVSFPPAALFTLENLPVHKMGSEELNCRGAVIDLI
jgi:hypothetical protein